MIIPHQPVDVEARPKQIEAVSIQAVLVSGHTGVAQFVEITGNDSFREDLPKLLVAGAILLGIMAFRYEDRQILYGRLALPWGEEDRAASEAFARICDEAEEKIQREAGRWDRPH